MESDEVEPEIRSEGLRPKDQINVLLKEYDTLRGEVLNRINHRWQMLGLIGAIVTFVSARDDAFLPLRLIPAYVAVIVLFVLWVRSGQYLAALSIRLAELEAKVNSLAGATLLEWETRTSNRPLWKLIRWHKP